MAVSLYHRCNGDRSIYELTSAYFSNSAQFETFYWLLIAWIKCRASCYYCFNDPILLRARNRGNVCHVYVFSCFIQQKFSCKLLAMPSGHYPAKFYVFSHNAWFYIHEALKDCWQVSKYHFVENWFYIWLVDVCTLRHSKF